MPQLRWILKDEKGTAMRSSEAFESREEAEGWMSSAWSRLRAEGAASVALMEGDREVYDMGLDEG